MTPEEPLISMNSVGRTFSSGGQVANALAEISFSVMRGETVAIVGPDASGKTTLMRILAGFMDPTSGSVISRAGTPGYMPQKFGLYPDLSVDENMHLAADLRGLPKNESREVRFKELLGMTGLLPFRTRPAGKLSGGMKQKLALAAALLSRPKLTVLDEPTVGVDPLSKLELWEIIRKMTAEDGTAFVVSTTDMREAANCSRVILLDSGRVLASGTPEELSGRAAGRTFTVSGPESVSVRLLEERLAKLPGIQDAAPRGGKVEFLISPDANPAELCRKAGLGTPEPRKPTLEDAFFIISKNTADTVERAFKSEENETPPPKSWNPEHPDRDPIAVHEICRKFGDFVAVHQSTFNVKCGEIFGLLGPNGAGKTTTFRMLCGLLPPSSGEMNVAGVDPRRSKAGLRRHIGYVAQKFSLYTDITVQQNLDFFARSYGLSPEEIKTAEARVIREFGLGHLLGVQAKDLTGGAARDLSMACALMHCPAILFLDEPTSGADLGSRRVFWHRITALAASGVSVVVTTHFMEEAEFCDRILIQDKGQVLALGTASEIREQADHSPDMESAFITIVRRFEKGAES